MFLLIIEDNGDDDNGDDADADDGDEYGYMEWWG